MPTIPEIVPVTTSSAEIRAVYMPCGSGPTARRTDIAGPHSLNEPGRPGRTGSTPHDMCAELAIILDWLAVDKPTHKRYQPREMLTFCNVYVHDYCYLSGVYLPRVWWTPAGIEALAQGQKVEPCYGETIDEQRANDLYCWLRDFGQRFGWQQTDQLSRLQEEVNRGSIGLIAARRKQAEFSGHIAAVVPETEVNRACRNQAGEVIAPLQSQAGTVNFRYGSGMLDWWRNDQFAESGFWFHS